MIGGAPFGRIKDLEADLATIASVLTVESFGAVGDYYFGNGSVNPNPTDDTQAIQAAVTYATLNHCRLDWKTGKGYAISSPILIGNIDASDNSMITWFELFGNRCAIIQMTDNTPIFQFIVNSISGTNGAVDRWAIRSFQFKWKNNQTSAHTNSFAIAAKATADNTSGISNFVIEDILCWNGYTVCGINDRTKICTAWGGVFRKIIVLPMWVGRIIDFYITPSTAHVNLKFDHIYINAMGISAANTDLFYIKEANSLTFDNIEVIRCTSSVKRVFFLMSCVNVHYGRFRMEMGTYATDWQGIITHCQVRGGSIDDIQIQSINFAITDIAHIFSETDTGAGVGTEIKNISIMSCTLTAGKRLALFDPQQHVNFTGNLYFATDNYYFGTENGFTLTYSDPDRASLHKSEFHLQNETNPMTRGDANVTLVNTDNVIQLFNTALTANRTITLPATANCYDGLRFRIVRTGTEAFTLAIGSVKTIPSGTAAWADIVYCSGWKLIGYGTL